MEIKFDELKNLSVPDGWEERALRLQATAAPKRRLRPLYLAASAAAAVLVAVSVLSVVWLMRPEPQPRLPIAAESASSVYPSEATASTAAPSAAMPSAQASVSVPATEPTEAALPATATVAPSAAPTVPATAPKPTTPPTTASVYSTMPLVDGSTSSATYPTAYPSGCTLQASFSADRLTGQGSVYCRLIDSNGATLGESELFSVQHLAAATVSGDAVTATYRPAESGVHFEEGESYTIVFYNESGEALAQSVPMPLFTDLVIILKG